MQHNSAEILTIDINGRTWKLTRPADLDTLWDHMDVDSFDEDERIPYWVELWPAGIRLARWLDGLGAELAGKQVLDVGCGLGLTACVASTRGATVTAMDYEHAALVFARRNATLNRVRQPGWVQADWRQPAFKPEAFNCIWGADILYESRFFEPLARLFETALAPGGTVWITEPVRDVSRPVWNRIRSLGWMVDLVSREVINYRDCSMRVNLWELKRKARSRFAMRGVNSGGENSPEPLPPKRPGSR